jgi:hypothetical protein
LVIEPEVQRHGTMNPFECFVIMPFGAKQFPDASNRLYDFDKVYRVIIQRAIRESDMTPVRADERVSSAIVHSEMFRDLRDRGVVLADLSLDNPNVFYELGIRHVMSRSGTVLICRKGSVLPFDVKLSRVIFYDFDGTSLDWEEVERVVGVLKVALTQARKGQPDSPVHALLETVVREPEVGARISGELIAAENAPDGEPAEQYQRIVADVWQRSGQSLKSLFEHYRGSLFGLRALAYLCLATDCPEDPGERLANQLNDGQQYRLANQLFKRLDEANRLTRGSLLAYASSYAEAHPDLQGAKHAIEIAERVHSLTELEYGVASSADVGTDVNAVADYAACHRRIAGLRQWQWQLTKDPSDLDRAIRAFDAAVQWNSRARILGVLKHPGFLAQVRLKLLLLLREKDGNVGRPDQEGHRDAIVKLATKHGDDPKGPSYLGWYQAVTLADLGAAEQSQQVASKTRISDARLMSDPQHWEIGRRQYAQLRRFLEQYLPFLRNHSLVGKVAQELQWGEASR